MERGQMKKGVLEMCMLSVVSKGDMYGYEIMKRVTEAFPDINESTVYAVLRRLRSDGCTETYTGEVSGGPQRKYYRITQQGLDRLEKMTEEWNRLIRSVKMLGI